MTASSGLPEGWNTLIPHNYAVARHRRYLRQQDEAATAGGLTYRLTGIAVSPPAPVAGIAFTGIQSEPFP
jgi:hypothetical protein